MPFLHFDEAKQAALTALRHWLVGAPPAVRALLIVDLFGQLRLTLWSISAVDTAALDQVLSMDCGPWWTGEILRVEQADQVTRDLYDGALESARSDPDDLRLLVLDRHRSRTAWFASPGEPPWSAPEEGPPIVVFYSFKGGLGRSTLLASFATQRSRAGERVGVLDFDLDSPGVGRLLSADSSGLTARWGVVDFLLERFHADLPLGDYYHRCDRVAGAGEIVVFPAGHLDEEYANKLAHVDLEEAPAAADSGLWELLHQVRDELKPNWILIDARTGLSEPAGQLLSGIAHLHVLLGTAQDQSWQGLERVLDRLGRERVFAERPQAEVLLVHAMVPVGDVGKLTREAFAAQAERVFTDRYFAATDEEGADDERFWDTRDMDTRDAPHVPIPIEYDAKFASFGDIAEVADALCGGPYLTAAERIMGRFTTEAAA